MDTAKSDPYRAIVERSERLSWTVDGVLGKTPELDFDRPFLPASLSLVDEMGFLSPEERLRMTQIQGGVLARVTAVFEEGILPFVMNQLADRSSTQRDEVRALLRFADEEVKHMQLFSRYADAVEGHLGVAPEIVVKREMTIEATRRNHPLNVALMSAHIEWMSQVHHVESSKDQTMDPVSARMHTAHYQEEVQHARIDELLIEAIGQTCTPDEITSAIADYRVTCKLMDGVFAQQAEHDVRAFEQTSRRELGSDERATLTELLYRGLSGAFLGKDGTHPRVTAAIERLDARAAA